MQLDVKTREYIHIKKVRKDLDEVIEYEYVAKENDSILNIVALSDADRILYFEKYIDKLKKSDEAKKALEDKQKETLAIIDRNSINNIDDPATSKAPGRIAPLPTSTIPANSGNGAANLFYFYNPSTVAFGKIEFKKKFGNRTLGGNWRLSTNKFETDAIAINDTTTIAKTEIAQDIEEYKTIFYLDQLPKTEAKIEDLNQKRNFAYYQLGIIYKEKFKEYELASKKLERLLTYNPEEKLVLPTMYNLYKIYQIIDNAKAEDMKSRISSQYPDSRYAQIINNTNATVLAKDSPEDVYDKWYKLYQEEHFTEVLAKLDELILQYSGDEIVAKFELLKANILGKLQGLEAYKNAMQYVADNYPTSEEGKNALEILTNQIPTLEKVNFNTTDTKNWKILYKVGQLEDKNTKALEDKIKKFIASENVYNLKYSFDVYTEKENFLTISGIKSEAYAKDIAEIIKTDKKYKIAETAIIISNENYKVVQIKKNLDEYLALSKGIPVSVQPTVIPASPETKQISPAEESKAPSKP